MCRVSMQQLVLASVSSPPALPPIPSPTLRYDPDADNAHFLSRDSRRHEDHTSSSRSRNSDTPPTSNDPQVYPRHKKRRKYHLQRENMPSHLTELVQKRLLSSHQVLARQVREMAGERDHYQSLYDQVRGS